jgi:hypothetical protein
MKTVFLAALIAGFLLMGTNPIQSQTTDDKLNQMELLKQWQGTWKCEIGKDTIDIQYVNLFGKAMIDSIITVSKGKILAHEMEIWGYDQTHDKIIAAGIGETSPAIYLYAAWFTSKDTMTIVQYQYISSPEKANFKIECVIKSPDLITRTVFANGKALDVKTYNRVKK